VVAAGHLVLCFVDKHVMGRIGEYYLSVPIIFFFLFSGVLFSFSFLLFFSFVFFFPFFASFLFYFL